MKSAKNKIFKFILDILFPSFCAACGKEGSFLCDACAAKITIKRVPAKIPGAPKIKTVYAATEYRDPPVTKLIMRLKYKGAKEIGGILAGLIISHLDLVQFKKENEYVIVPVPLHKKRLAKRGFNQSELIARKIAERLNMPIAANALKRIKNTIPQTEVAQREKRRENVKNAFSCARPETVKDKKVILVDDVATTGATLNECARALRQASAKTVIAFIAAH